MVTSSDEERLFVTSVKDGTPLSASCATTAACPSCSRLFPKTRIWTGWALPPPPSALRRACISGTIASQGNQTYDLSGFVNPAHPLPPGCNIKIEGIAPGASLAVLNVAGSNAGFFNSQIIQAVQWAVMHDHVNILNESLGGNPVPNTQDDPVSLADQAARAAALAGKVELATQSGPLLVEAGRIHPVFKPGSTSLLFRNGVGVVEPHTVCFAISEEPVNFYEFATLFRDVLHCPDALFLDGTISSLHAPALKRSDKKIDLGPMIGIVGPIKKPQP